ncbi:MAG TPA: type II toxin-antitoxin system CcdA family antitoxin [Allosphingosinicella sp.]|nr:type II toxin-antitoxin system CcdA family antitoxin [Allosphingosinicella sp.]
MRMNSPARKISPSKRATNVSLRSDLIDEARGLGINISEACERGLTDEVARSRREAWLAENMPALEAWNEWVRENGIPYAEYRRP